MPRQKQTKLDWIEKVLPDRRGGLELKDGYAVVSLLRKNKSIPEIAKAIDRSESGTQMFLRELKQAGQKGITLEDYMAQGRPFRIGKKVVTPTFIKNGAKEYAMNRAEYNRKRREKYAREKKQ